MSDSCKTDLLVRSESKDASPYVVFAGGGSGGHLYPPLAVAAAIRVQSPRARIRFFCTERSIDRSILGVSGESYVGQPVLPVPSRPWRLPSFWRSWRKSTEACRAAFVEDRPAVVIGSGGFASAPSIVVASKLGIPTALLNPDAQPGRANRFLLRRASAIFIQWQEAAEHFPAASPLRVVGCPIRSAFLSADRATGIELFGLKPDRKTLLVTGASQGASAINNAMASLAQRLAKNSQWQVLHLTGPADLEAVCAAYDAAGVSAVCLAYTERMAEALAAADLVVSRAGASTLAEITALGRPSILIPYPYDRHQHQLVNAKVLALYGAARICRESGESKEWVDALGDQLLAMMGEQRVREEVAERSALLGRIDAAGAIATQVLSLARVRRKAVA